jgi:allantoicase
MVRTIPAAPLTEEAFSRFGGLLAANLTLPRSITSTGGASTQWIDCVTISNTYHESSKPGKAIMNMFVTAPKPTTKLDNREGRSFLINVMERHPYTNQVFMPMSRDAKYLVVVADTNADDSAPDMRTAMAFVAGEGQGISYGKAVWHASMTVVGQVSWSNPFQGDRTEMGGRCQLLLPSFSILMVFRAMMSFFAHCQRRIVWM